MGIDETLYNWDGRMCTVRHDRVTGTSFVIALHSTERGPAAGGTRAMHYVSLAEAVTDATRLAEVMTLKMAAADLPMGGGKSVIALPAPRHDIDQPTWDRILTLHAENLTVLAGNYWTGPDVGTASADMDALHAASGFAFGRSVEAGGPGSSAPTTAQGVYVALLASAAHAGIDQLRGRRVTVQGLGAVGMDIVEMLVKDDADVTASDIEPDRCRAAQALGARIVEPGEIMSDQSDVFVPCAVGGVIDDEAAETIGTRVIAGAANNVLANASAADVLARRGIVFAPDFIANSGGAMHLVGREVLGWGAEEVARHVGSITGTLDDVFALAETKQLTTETAARQLAAQRLDTECLDKGAHHG